MKRRRDALENIDGELVQRLLALACPQFVRVLRTLFNISRGLKFLIESPIWFSVEKSVLKRARGVTARAFEYRWFYSSDSA